VNESKNNSRLLFLLDDEWESPWTHQRGVDLYAYLPDTAPDPIASVLCLEGRE